MPIMRFVPWRFSGYFLTSLYDKTNHHDRITSSAKATNKQEQRKSIREASLTIRM